MAEEDGDSNFQSTLEIQNVTHQVKLTATHIFWGNAHNKTSSDSACSEPLFRHFAHCVPVKEIITAYAEKPRSEELSHDRRKNGSPVYIEMRPIRPQAFTLQYLKRSSKYKWRNKKTTFHSREAYLCQQWVHRIQEAINKLNVQRPKSLLVFVNPYGGKKKGPKIYSDKVAPLFDKAGIRTDVITTQRQNHARDIIQTYDLSRIDGVVVVGGDGMFSEMLNGLIERKQREMGVSMSKEHDPIQPELTIGIIPAGSTDAIVYSTTGISDPVTSALHIILGDKLGLDVGGVYCGDQLQRYMVTMLSYGYYGDMLLDSEKNRWMGPKRYQISGAKKFLANRAYEGEVSFVLSSEADTNPRDNTTCLYGCNVCRLSQTREDNSANRAATASASYMSGMSSEGSVSKRHDSPGPGADGWHRVKGKFKVVSSFTMPCRCALTPHGVAPSSHLGDGTTDLMLVGDCSRAEFLKHLIRCPDKGPNHFDFDFVQVYRVKEFRYRALKVSEEEEVDSEKQMAAAAAPRLSTRRTSVWNCDGEILENANVDVKIYCQLIKIFARGIEEAEQTFQCCMSCDEDS